MGGWETFYSPMIGSQSFSELHKHFPVFLSPLRWGKVASGLERNISLPHATLEMAGVGISLPPGQLGSDNTPTG